MICSPTNSTALILTNADVGFTLASVSMVRRIATMLQVASTNAWEELAELLHDDRVTVDRTGDDGAVHPDINLCPPDATAPALRQLLESIDALRQAGFGQDEVVELADMGYGHFASGGQMEMMAFRCGCGDLIVAWDPAKPDWEWTIHRPDRRSGREV